MTTRLPIVRRHLEAVAYLMVLFVSDYIIIIRRMYVYCALINALSAHTIHIKLNTILYTHIERSPTKTIYIGYYMETHTHTHTHTHTNDHSRNWVLTLVGVEILWEEEGFQFGFERWQDWKTEWKKNTGKNWMKREICYEIHAPVQWETMLKPVSLHRLAAIVIWTNYVCNCADSHCWFFYSIPFYYQSNYKDSTKEGDN